MLASPASLAWPYCCPAWCSELGALPVAQPKLLLRRSPLAASCCLLCLPLLATCTAACLAYLHLRHSHQSTTILYHHQPCATTRYHHQSFLLLIPLCSTTRYHQPCSPAATRCRSILPVLSLLFLSQLAPDYHSRQLCSCSTATDRLLLPLPLPLPPVFHTR